MLARLRVTLRRAEKFPLAFVLGAACVHLALFAIFAMKIAYKPVLLSFAIAVIAASLLPRNRLRADRDAPFSITENLPAVGYVILFAVFTGLYFIIAWAPETSADGSNYHLGLIARYLHAHGFVPITTNMYAGLGQGAEMLYALAFAFGGIQRRRWCICLLRSRWRWRCSLMDSASANGGSARARRCWCT